MPLQTPTQEQAHSFHAEQAAIASRGASEVFGLLRIKAPWTRILSAWASAQYRSAVNATRVTASFGNERPRSNPRPIAGVSSRGHELHEPLVATIDRIVPAPAQALPASWWVEAREFQREVEQLIEAEIQDAGRAAARVEMAAHGWQNYVRALVPPSCKRCVVLAGRIYRDNEGFLRHPGCDCQNIPVQDWVEAHDAGLVFSPQEAFDKGYIRDLTRAERMAIEYGADVGTVINSASGISATEIFGRRMKTTTYGTTRRAAWRKANPSLLVRLRPEAIFELAGDDPAERRRLLTTYGYIT